MPARKPKAKPSKNPTVKARPARKAKDSSKSKSRTIAAKAAKPKAARTKSKPRQAKPSDARFVLPERFDSSTASSVLEAFKSHRGRPLIVDASTVRRAGAQSIQILVSASRTWQVDGHQLSVENPSAELVEAVSLLGLASSDLSFPGHLQ